MEKETLSEDILRGFFIDKIYESLNLDEIEKKGLNSMARNRVGDMLNYLMTKAQNADDNDDIIQKAKEYGLNKDYLQGKISKQEYRDEYNRRALELVNTKNEAITQWVKSGLPLLRSCVAGMGLRQDLDRYVKSSPNSSKQTHGTGDIYSINNRVKKALTPNEKAEVLLLKDFLDKLNLSFLYRRFERPKTVGTKFGVDTKNMNINDTTDVDDIGINFGELTNDELLAFYESRKSKLNGWAKKVEWADKEMTKLNTDILLHMHGKKNQEDETNRFYNDENSGSISALTEISYKYQVARRYLDRTYGLALDFGKDNDMYKFGNTKISNDTLIINFQAAMRCPAWQDCIMKDSCYAKISEINRDNPLNSNLKRGFIWEQTRTDSKLMEIMTSLIRACMINYQRAVQEYEKIHKKEKQGSNQLYLDLNEGYTQYTKNLSDKLCDYTFQKVFEEYGQEMIDLFIKHRMGSLIRLNESGDFIGQWLVDAWEEIATDFKLVGINITAYTCRALNFEKVKNMILNISQANLVKYQDSEAFAHYFYAITQDEYDKLPETYAGSENGFQLSIDNEGKITPCYRNLVDENGELCGYYYKCPCGRFNNGNDKLDEANKEKPGNKVDCYRCRICYARDEMGDVTSENGEKPEPNLPVFVFVAVHGENSGLFTGKKTHRTILGRDVSYWINSINKYKNTPIAQNEPQINENTNKNEMNVGANDDIVMKEITNNMTMSVANMMRSKQTRLNEVKDNFNKILKNIQ